ncbi:MAG TPA: succinic semialdehyde dehydrogenase [Cellulomonas sp.]|uniref:succinic semialdehyde dehydrogenase n=1 Tax=Cellulomonas sp. TaxID=40001 RepID=UPI002E318439|nr:succinic semialdehyde dehydrogenase [Cellulomonas sp.]HEX5332458.1 succinic semialdehyde dehydrogenase [Cellulomonas sp.]
MAYEPEHAHLIDPETDPRATYVLEPEDIGSLVARIVTSPGAATFTTYAPFTGGPIAAVPLSTPADVERATAAARRAQRTWATVPLRERCAVLLRLHDLLLEHQSDVLDLIQLESGKSRASAFEEVADVALVARHYALHAKAYLADRHVRGLVPGLTSVRVLRHPVGVVGIIAPWNYPLTLTLGDALPALVAGNAVVLRPDPQTALTALWAVEQLEAAGLPEGVLQVVVGDGVALGTAVVDHVDHVVFTGSTATGRIVAARAGERLIPVTLELGGKNPMYVAEDVDVEVAAAGAVRACFGSTGQLCISIERLYVHEHVADAFLDAFARRTRDLRLATDLDYRSDVGSLTSAAQLATVVEHVEDALTHGAVVVAGGVHRIDLGPLFYEPTILDGVTPDARVFHEETFGPVVSVYRVASDDEAVAAMNDSPYGLNASVWTRSARRGAAIAARVHAGTVNVNEGYVAVWGSTGAPQGGRGHSGLGHRHGREGLWATTDLQSVAIQRGAHGVFGGPPMGLQRLFDLGTERWPVVFTHALRAMRALRLP